MINQRAEEEKLKRDMVCPYSRVPIKNMPALKAHVGSQRWRELCMASEGSGGERVKPIVVIAGEINVEECLAPWIVGEAHDLFLLQKPFENSQIRSCKKFLIRCAC